jgi:hypothetical protein
MIISNVMVGGVINNTLDRNEAGSGGVMQVATTAMEVFNNIIVNSAGHGIVASGATLPVVGYNLVWNSTGNDYEGIGGGEGATTGDPVFADTSSGDYHLGPHSPAIDAGKPDAAYEDSDGSRGDMGWYGSNAVVMDQPSYPKNPTLSIESGDVVLTWDLNPEPDVDQYFVYRGSESGFKPSLANLVATISTADSSVNLGAPLDSSYYLVGAVDTDGYASGFSSEVFQDRATAAGEWVTYRTQLYQNVPNPFNPSTTIRFELREQADVSLIVYDVAGRSVKRLSNGTRTRGVHTVSWDGTNDAGEHVSSGIYFYRLDAGSYVQTRKMLLLK